MTTTRQTLEQILADADLTNEAGEPLQDFTDQGRDALDFTSVSRGMLERLLTAAYTAGCLDTANAMRTAK